MKIAKLLLLSIPVILISCDKDSDPVPSSDNLAGAWLVTGVDYKGTSTTTGQGFNATANFTGTGKDMDLTTTFQENPNTVTSQGSYIIELKTTYLGQTVTTEVPFEDVFIEGTWSLDGTTLTVTNPGGTQEATITKLTSTTLEFNLNVTQTQMDQGYTVTSDIQVAYTFARK